MTKRAERSRITLRSSTDRMTIDPHGPQQVPHSEPSTAAEWLQLVYQELRQLAAAHMSRQSGTQTIQPTALVHEAWLRIVASGERDWKNREHFFRTAAQAMRQILVDRARRKSTLKINAQAAGIDSNSIGSTTINPDDRLLLIDEALQKLEITDPHSARIVTLRFFAGMTNEEVAKVLACSISTVERKWAYAKVCLLEIIHEEERRSNS